MPASQHVDAPRVVAGMAAAGHGRVVELDPPRIVVLALLGGGFITSGALLSALLGTGLEPTGVRALVEGFAFSVGFFFVVLSEAVLFTEANVVLPATLLDDRRIWLRVLRFWALAWLGNLVGAWLFGTLISLAQDYPPEVLATLGEIVDGKLAYRDVGGAQGWWRLVLSGVLANWLVGMAAFFAFMGRTIIGKYLPVLLAVTLFVAAGFQHSPANMGFVALHIASGGDLDWATALGWSIVPAGIGNMLGAALLVALPYWYVFQRPLQRAHRAAASGQEVDERSR
ncbi:MAG: formate/nitrite transporter family protein [Egibacteraceae bacterium]